MVDSASDFFRGLEAVAGTSGAAAAGVMALTFELVKSGVIPAVSGQRVGDAMVRSMGRRGVQHNARHDIAAAIESGFKYANLQEE